MERQAAQAGVVVEAMNHQVVEGGGKQDVAAAVRRRPPVGPAQAWPPPVLGEQLDARVRLKT